MAKIKTHLHRVGFSTDFWISGKGCIVQWNRLFPLRRSLYRFCKEKYQGIFSRSIRAKMNLQLAIVRQKDIRKEDILSGLGRLDQLSVFKAHLQLNRKMDVRICTV